MLPSSSGLALLCGGRSSRFGSNKALAFVDGSTMIERIVKQVQKAAKNLILVTNTPQEYAFLNLPCLIDSRPYAGPLAALLTVFEKTLYEHIVLIACDMPRVDQKTIHALWKYVPTADACVMRDAAGPQYLLARYSRRLAKPFSEFVLQGGKSFRDFFQFHPSGLVFLDSEKKIPNVNTERDLKEYQCSVI
jgi:molybdenum cofactor guanylyltransferase